jgi:hypothetical protein
MLILFALGKLFPGEEVGEDVETNGIADGVSVTDQAGQLSAQSGFAAVVAQQPSAVSVGSGDGRIPGAKIAAIAVSMYLATEQEERVLRAPAPAATMNLSDATSVWATLGRNSLMENQGRRPQSYNQKSHSAYSPRTGLR